MSGLFKLFVSPIVTLSTKVGFAHTGTVALAAVLLLGGGVTPWALGQTYREQVLYRFAGPTHRDGANPEGNLIRDAAGNLYGTTAVGGISNVGTVFQVTNKGKERVLHSFTNTGSDGMTPFAALVRDPKGNLYGTTFWGGSSNAGTVFTVTNKGKETVLHDFTDTGGDAYPAAGLVRDADGNFYGTTSGGEYAYGTVFKVDAIGKETVLYSFGGSDGANPKGNLIRDAAGNLYGTTYMGGAFNNGTVFELDSAGKETVLYSFAATGTGDGRNPAAGLVRDAKGNFYGTTSLGGAYDLGTVFRLDPTGKETVLHSFSSSGGDGTYPDEGLLLEANGNLYGTTYLGGAYGKGTVFKLEPTGKETILHNFTATGGDGASPAAGLLRDAKGNLYGTTQSGGDLSCNAPSGCGIVFKLTP